MGVVHVAGSVLGGPPGVDTITVLERPEPGAPPVARFLLRRDSLSWGYELEARAAAAEGSAVQYGYEESGLPVLPGGVDAPAGWLEVRYATGPAGEALTGWVRREPERLELLLWEDRLTESPLFFLDADSIRFFSSPGGSEVQLPLAPDPSPQRFDYIMHPLEARGPWARVEVVSPSDYCFFPEAPRRDTAWVRRFDASGRPRVWYYTRGC